jgi:hypothetical protein
MKRFTFLAVVLAVVAALAVTPLASGFGDAKGPPCGDIINGGGRTVDGYFGTIPGAPATFDFSMDLSASSCAGPYTYMFHVSAGGGAFTDIAGVTDGTSRVIMPQQTYSSAPQAVCVYAESLKPNGAVADRAPDAGCLTYVLNEAPGNQSFG